MSAVTAWLESLTDAHFCMLFMALWFALWVALCLIDDLLTKPRPLKRGATLIDRRKKHLNRWRI